MSVGLDFPEHRFNKNAAEYVWYVSPPDSWRIAHFKQPERYGTVKYRRVFATASISSPLFFSLEMIDMLVIACQLRVLATCHIWHACFIKDFVFGVLFFLLGDGKHLLIQTGNSRWDERNSQIVVDMPELLRKKLPGSLHIK